MTKFTVQNFPMGTVVELDQFTIKDGKLVMGRYPDELPAVLTVKEVRIDLDATLIVTTMKNPDYMAEHDMYYTFHIDWVTKIVKLGNRLKVVKITSIVYKDFVKGNYSTYSVHTLGSALTSVANKYRPLDDFDTEKMIKKASEDGFIKYLGIDKPNKLSTLYNMDASVLNKRRLKSWMKRNVNRFLLKTKAK